MNRAQRIYKQLKALPYYRNYQAVSGSIHNISSHEDAVEDVLKNNSLIQSNFKELSYNLGFTSVVKFRDVLLQGEQEKNIPNNVYFNQPTGTHNSPDFIFKVNNKVYFLECKSSKLNKPVYNGGLPKNGYIYLFCSERYNESTMYLGDDIVNNEQRKLLIEFIEESDKSVTEFNKKLKSFDNQNRGISYYQRHMWQQSGGADYTDYFNHENRELCEIKVENLFNDTEANK